MKAGHIATYTAITTGSRQEVPTPQVIPGVILMLIAMTIFLLRTSLSSVITV